MNRSLAIASLALVGCRREPVIRHDTPPAVVDAAPAVAADPLLVHGKVVDLTRFEIVHRLAKVPPLVETQMHGVGWLVVPHGVAEAYDLKTGRRLLGTTARCGSLTPWGDRVICRQDDKLLVLDQGGGSKTLAVTDPGSTLVPLDGGLIAYRFGGELEMFGADGARLATHPAADDFFANVFEDGDGYCMVGERIECRKADGSRRFRVSLDTPLPATSFTSVKFCLTATELMISRTAGSASATAVARIHDGKIIGRASPAADILVERGDGTSAAMLRTGASSTELVDFDGKVRWSAPLSFRPTHAFAFGETILVADTSKVTSLRAKDGTFVWERALDIAVAAQESIRLRKGLIYVRERSGSLSRLRLLDAATGEIRFTDSVELTPHRD